MISKERLEELIKNEALIYGLTPLRSIKQIELKKFYKIENDKVFGGVYLIALVKNLFETKEEITKEHFN